MTTERPWPDQLTRITSAEIRRYRKLRGMTTDQLAGALTELLGSEYKRDAVVNIERPGRRTSITVSEILAYAAVLGVPPALLVVPVGTDNEIEYLPFQRADPWHVYGWFTGGEVGSWSLTDHIRPPAFEDGADKLTAYRNHDSAAIALESVRHETADADAVRELEQARLQVLLAQRREMRRAGWALPTLAMNTQRLVDDAERGTVR